MKVRFWGVRGSIPVPGPLTERYGGNTSCVEVITGAGTRLCFDAGTGMRGFGQQLMQTEFERGAGTAHVLISHTHWDHIHGLPFFAPLGRKGNRIELYARASSGPHLKRVLETAPEGSFFPAPYQEPRATVTVHEVADESRFEIGDARVSCARLNHPYVATAFSIVADEAKVVYVSDTAPFADILFGQEFVAGPPLPNVELPPATREALRAMRAAVVRLCEGADLVIYDTMFTADDYRQTPHYGHSRPLDALAICQDAGARTLALYHHAPERTDAEVDLMLADTRTLATRAGAAVMVIAAYEGLNLQFGRA
jgi:phosphoribosyl 1,2-cyclic phosphodiesterase